MSGHSKWSKVKHQKKVTDAVKGSAFTKASKAIAIAISEGGGITDPNRNHKLRLALEKAREVNMPKDTIKRAISKASDPNTQLTISIYEAYGPGKVAILIETATDNSNRTISMLKNIIEKNNGIMVNQGTVSALFKRVGKINIVKEDIDNNKIFDIAVNAGAEDVTDNSNDYIVYTKTEELMKVKNNIEKEGINIKSCQVYMKPQVFIDVSDPDKLKSINNLITKINKLEEVQRVFTNVK